MTHIKPQILIVGAGPTGLTAAVELARLGHLPRIIDRDDGPTPLSKAVGISPRSLDLLEPAGVTTRLLARGIKLQAAHFHYGDAELGRFDLGRLEHRFNFLLSLPQSETEGIMTSVFEGFGGRVEWRTRFAGLEIRGDAIEVMLEGPEGLGTLRCSHVFGADGGQSAVREAIGLDFEGYTHQRKWSIADVEMAQWPFEHGAAHLFLHSGGDVGFIIPMSESRFRAVSNTEDVMSRIAGAFRVARVLRTDTFHIPIRQAPTYQKGGVFLGGDAAHVHSPVGARGMNLGIEDAASFARHFEKGSLAGYTAERHPVGKRWIALSERVLRLAQADGPVKTRLRNLGLRLAGRLPALQKPALRRLAGLRE